MIHAEPGDLTALHAPAGFPSTRAWGGGESAQSKLTILYVSNTSDVYGASRCLVALVKALDPARMTPVVVLPEAGPLKELFAEIGVEVLVCPSLAVITRFNFHPFGVLALLVRLPQSVLKLRSLIREHRVALVHTNTGVILSSSLAAWLAGVPHVWHVREIFGDFRRLWPFFARFVLVASQRVIAISRAVARQFPPSEKVAIVYDGLSLADYEVDHARMRQEFRTRFGIGAGLVVGCVGRIKLGRKGQDELVRAAGLLKQRGVSVKYLVVGTPFPGNESHLARLLGMIEELGLRDDIILAGEMRDVRPAYAAIDILVHPPTQPEPFGMVILEAMALGVPVIATRHGGPVDIIEEGRSGFLVTPSDTEALANAIERLAADEGLRRSLGAAGRERVASHFSASVAGERIVDIYNQLTVRGSHNE